MNSFLIWFACLPIWVQISCVVVVMTVWVVFVILVCREDVGAEWMEHNRELLERIKDWFRSVL